MSELELPETFFEWPPADQLEYVEHTSTKPAVMQSVMDELGVDVDVDNHYTGGLKKGQWAKILVAVVDDA